MNCLGLFHLSTFVRCLFSCLSVVVSDSLGMSGTLCPRWRTVASVTRGAQVNSSFSLFSRVLFRVRRHSYVSTGIFKQDRNFHRAES